MNKQEIDAVVVETNAVTVSDKVRAQLVADLGPIADRIDLYAEQAAGIVVRNVPDAENATAVCDQIAADIKAVKSHEVLSKITDGLHKLHRRWTSLRDEFVTPLEASRREIKGKVIAWQEAERIKAEAEQRRLQAEADEKARKEREKLEAQAAKLKTPEKREERLEQAAAVIAPTVKIEAPKAMKVSKVWVVESVDESAFYAALARDPSLRGYVSIEVNKLARSKAANNMLEIAGVKFVQKVR